MFIIRGAVTGVRHTAAGARLCLCWWLRLSVQPGDSVCFYKVISASSLPWQYMRVINCAAEQTLWLWAVWDSGGYHLLFHISGLYSHEFLDQVWHTWVAYYRRAVFHFVVNSARQTNKVAFIRKTGQCAYLMYWLCLTLCWLCWHVCRSCAVEVKAFIYFEENIWPFQSVRSVDCNMLTKNKENTYFTNMLNIKQTHKEYILY